jgi:hypothetical protein
LNTTGKRAAIVCFHDQVEVIALHRVVD